MYDRVPRISFLTALALRLFAPHTPDLLWRIAARRLHRGSAIVEILWAIIVVVLLVSNTLPSSWPLHVLSIMVAVAYSLAPVRFASVLRSRGVHHEILAVPFSSRDYTFTFLRIFAVCGFVGGIMSILSELLCYLVDQRISIVWQLTRSPASRQVDLPGILMFLASIFWLRLWCSVLGGWYRLIPICFIAALVASLALAIVGVDTWLFRLASSEFQYAFVIMQFIAGMAMFLYCRARYAEVLRERLFP